VESVSNKALYLFGDIVVVDESLIGVIVKTWETQYGYRYEVYVRMANGIKEYDEKDVQRYRVRHKYLDEQEMEWQNG
jgi:hypothetical protein